MSKRLVFGKYEPANNADKNYRKTEGRGGAMRSEWVGYIFAVIAGILAGILKADYNRRQGKE